MLNDEGILSFVLPKSFLNCLYYDKTRKYIADYFKILHIIDCIDDKFIDTQQDTIIVIIQNMNIWPINIECLTGNISTEILN